MFEENVLGAFHNVQVFDSAQSRFFSSLLFDNKRRERGKNIEFHFDKPVR
jgi:hypothetical protein